MKDGKPNIQSEHLFSLTMADPRSKETLRELPDKAYSGAFDAWQVAQDSIHQAWTVLTDPNNLTPEPPLSFRDAFDFVNQKGMALGLELQSRTLSRLRSVPMRNVSNAMRGVLNLSVSDSEKVQAIIELLDNFGIQPAPEPKALPEVSKAEVRLVAWMAVLRG